MVDLLVLVGQPLELAHQKSEFFGFLSVLLFGVNSRVNVVLDVVDFDLDLLHSEHQLRPLLLVQAQSHIDHLVGFRYFVVRIFLEERLEHGREVEPNLHFLDSRILSKSVWLYIVEYNAEILHLHSKIIHYLQIFIIYFTELGEYKSHDRD